MPFMPPDSDGRGPGQLGPAFEALKAFIVSTTGNVRLEEQDDLLLEKISRRIKFHELPSREAYLRLLRHGAQGSIELDCLIAELTIGETSFFRHQEQFDALRDHVLPACLRRNSDTRHLRIWSAGCANGAEAYSIALLVHTLLGDRYDAWNVAIIGSDINRTFLAEADIGQYSAWTLRDTPEMLRSALFVRHGGGWCVRERYRRDVRFVYHNLVSEQFRCFDKAVSSFDIIMCRNVMIYFDPATNKQLAERLAAALAVDGWLFTGPADFNPYLESTFTLEKLSGALIYRNRPPRPHDATIRSAVSSAAVETSAKRSAEMAAVTPRNRTTASLRGGRRRRSEAAPLAGTRRDPRQPAAAPQHNIATLVELANTGQWAAAARYCEALLQADSCNAAAHYFYALVQQYSGSFEAAEHALKRAIYLDRKFALAHYQLGLVRKDARDIARCSRSFHNVLSALRDVPDDFPASPCGRITANDLRELATQQLAFLDRQRARQP